MTDQAKCFDCIHSVAFSRWLLVFLFCLSIIGCASTFEASNKLPKKADFPEGYGTIVGSVLLTVPGYDSNPDVKDIYYSLRNDMYNATIRRFIVHQYLFASRTEYVGDIWRVSFKPNVERRFVISAPAGAYSLLKLEDSTFVKFQTGMSLCMDFPASFNIVAGKTSYVGQLTIATDFISNKEAGTPIIVRKMPFSEIMNAFVTISVDNKKEQLLRELSRDESSEVSNIDSQLMRVNSSRLRLNSCPRTQVMKPPK